MPVTRKKRESKFNLRSSYSLLLVAALSGCATSLINTAYYGSGETRPIEGPSECVVIATSVSTIESDEPYDATRYDTQDMWEQYRLENIKESAAFGESQVSYLDEVQRAAYQLLFRSGKAYRANGVLFDTSTGQVVHSGTPRAIFVMDHYGRVYASDCQAVGNFHHSSFLAGAPIAAGGDLEARDGKIQLVTRRSGHYRHSKSLQDQFFYELERQGVDTSDVTREPGF